MWLLAKNSVTKVSIIHKRLSGNGFYSLVQTVQLSSRIVYNRLYVITRQVATNFSFDPIRVGLLL